MTDPCRYFIPGPTWVRPEIFQQMARPMIGHRSAEFSEMYGRVMPDVKTLFATQQDAFLLNASGTGAMQAALDNCVARRVLVTTCGGFSNRFFNIAQSLGYEVDRLDAGWGNAVDPESLADHLASRRAHYDAVTLTHNETSTGLTNDVAALAQVVHNESPDTLVIVDAVSSLGGMPVLFDEWGLDVCVAGVQKGLALPPGISLTAVSQRALDKARKHPYRGLYFDFLEYKKQHDGGNVPFTPAISHVYALEAQLEHMLRTETLAARFERHRQMRDLTISRIQRYAKLASDPEHASVTVSAIAPGRDPDAIRSEMKRRGFILGGGYGDWKATTFRIGHMGDIPLQDVETMLDALDEVMRG